MVPFRDNFPVSLQEFASSPVSIGPVCRVPDFISDHSVVVYVIGFVFNKFETATESRNSDTHFRVLGASGITRTRSWIIDKQS